MQGQPGLTSVAHCQIFLSVLSWLLKARSSPAAMWVCLAAVMEARPGHSSAAVFRMLLSIRSSSIIVARNSSWLHMVAGYGRSLWHQEANSGQLDMMLTITA